MDDRFNRNYLSILISVALCGTSFYGANALATGIVVDSSAPANQQAIITQTANGLPQVNIQTPSSAGVSRNKYSQFDVGKNGAILNNSASNVQTTLAGWVQGNSLLAGGSARIILNEVNSQNPSFLNGPMEVAGSKAQLVIANPAGISCDGCGFINADRSTLTTGRAIMNNGQLDGFQVETGNISIHGAGLDDSATAYTDLMARAVSVNADIWANNLTVITGKNRVSATNDIVAKLDTDGDKPNFSMDVSEIGGMYAGKIRLIGTEEGVGVKQSGEITARQSLTLTTDGRLINTGAIKSEAASYMEMAELQNTESSEIISGNLDIRANSTIENKGLINVNQLLIDAETLNNQPDARIYGDDSTFNTTTLNNHSVIAARDSLSISTETLFNDENAEIVSQGNIQISGGSTGDALTSAHQVTNSGGRIEASGDISINADELQNLNAGISTEWVTDSIERIIEVQPEGWAQKYDVSRFPLINNHNVERQPFTDENGNYIRNFEDYTYYDYTATTQSTHIISSSPAKIIAAGNIQLKGDVLNSDSQIVAGKTLAVTGGSLQNTATPGQKRVSYSGTRQFRDWDGNDEELDFGHIAPYSPATKNTEFNLGVSLLEDSHADIKSLTKVQDMTLPIINSAMFKLLNNPTQFYIETDPQFLDYKDWLSSDYMLQQLAFDPANTMKRLGDGYIEQRLVTEQIAQLTGHLYLSEYQNQQTQFMALMDAGVSVAEALQLTPGVAITDEQVAQLTTDIVWLVNTEVTLDNGEVITALIPKVYIKPEKDDLVPESGLLAGNEVTFEVEGQTFNSASIRGKKTVSVSSEHYQQRGGDVQGQSIAVNATDISIDSGTLSADNSLSLSADNDINITSSMTHSEQEQANSHFERDNIKRYANLYVSDETGKLIINAQRDVALNAVNINLSGEQSLTQIAAGQNLTLGTVKTSETNLSILNARDFNKMHQQTDRGTSLRTNGDVSLKAGNNLQLTAADINSQQGNLELAAKEVNVDNGEASYQSDIATYTKRSSGFSSRKKEQRDMFNQQTSVASSLTAKNISVESAKDINVKGSQILADESIQLNAAKDINITAAKQLFTESHYIKVKKSGISGTGGVGISIGTRKMNTQTDIKQLLHNKSTIGALNGDISMVAGEAFHQKNSDLISAKGDIDVKAKDINITSLYDSSETKQVTEFSQSGLSLSLKAPAISVATQAYEHALGSVEDDKKKNRVLHGITAYVQSKQLVEMGENTLNLINEGKADEALSSSGLKISISIGKSESKTQTETKSQTSQASTIRAGQNVRLTATDKNVLVSGSDILADGDITINAANDINILASQNTQQQNTKMSSSSASFGLSLGIGENTGLSLDMAMSKGKGKTDSDGVFYQNSHVTAAKALSLTTGNDLSLIGAQAKGEKVSIDVGNNLILSSLQDSHYLKGKESNSGGGVGIGIGTATSSFNLYQNTQKLNSDYLSVNEQTAIMAGQEGFDINVGAHSELDAAIIDSKAQADKNQITTATLHTTDKQNAMSAEVSQQGFRLSSDAFSGKYGMLKSVAQNLSNTGEANVDDASSTISAIAPAEITLTDPDKQLAVYGKTAEETLTDINRNTQNTHRKLNIADIEPLKDKAEAEQLSRQLVYEVATAFTDEAFRKMFLTKVDYYQVMRDENGEVIKDENDKAVWKKLTEEEKQHLKPGKDNKVHVFNNGMFNSVDDAKKLAVQNHQSDYLIDFPLANNAMSELMIAGYQKFLESEGVGLTNAVKENINVMGTYGKEGLIIDVHSRGAMTTGNALVVIDKRNVNESSILQYVNIYTVGSAFNNQQMADLLNKNSDQNGRVYAQVHKDDFVGTLIGGNEATGGTTPDGSTSLIEGLKSIFFDVTVHNSYGDGKPNGASKKYWQDSPDGKAKFILIRASNNKEVLKK
ncbi:hemagglutinin repeat-containing protein [Methylophaga sulfidovorans]|uniref:Filamentous hemagglutinin n=1 Tax=Methylophaga sulfidovorans TaxID=45496 RepID=A0A1I4ASN7_9GAMM|nr:hemagglutinin repeat-containing protein [Methylophaga sulfidovorans]SFK58739.1 filamentous hemagglutinin [Methylophaga sulfidovorans]